MWYYRRLESGLVVMHTRPEHADAARGAAARLLPHPGRRGAVQGPALPQARRAVRRRAVRRARRRPRRRRHLDHPPAVRLRARRPHLRRDHPGRLADLARSRPATGSTAPTSACIPTIAAAGWRAALYAARQEVVWRLGLRGQVTGGMLRGYGAVKDTISAEDYYAEVVAGPAHRPDAVDAARHRLRAARAAQGLPERSGVGQLQRAAGPRRRQGPARRVAGTGAALRAAAHAGARPAGQGDARAARGGAAGRARQGDRRRRRARPRLAALRRRRQHLHRLRQRHRRDRRRPRPGGGRRRGDGADAEVPAHLRAGHHLRADGPPGRGAQRDSRPATSPRRRSSPTAAPRRSRTRSSWPASSPAGRRWSASRAAITAARCSRSA